MFNIDDKMDEFKQFTDLRAKDKYVMPLFVQCGGTKYPLTDLDQIDYVGSIEDFIVGFGTSESIFIRNSFVRKCIYYFREVLRTFQVYDEETVSFTLYTIATATVTPDTKLLDTSIKNVDVVMGQVNEYIEMLYKRVSAIVEKKQEERRIAARESIAKYMEEIKDN
jgi:hypothetical protein